MELPYTKQQEEYIESIKKLEEDLKSTMSGAGETDLDLHIIQQKLDAIASEYQHNDNIGTARYKLYELQAFICYFEHQDNKALDFINKAIELRGGIYPKAEKLKENINSKIIKPMIANKINNIDESTMTKKEKRQRLIGVEGWLAWFLVGLFIAAFQTVYNLFYGGLGVDQADVTAFNDYQAGLGDAWQTMVALESIGLVIFIVLLVISIVLILRRKKLAIKLVIATLIYGIVYSIIDYAAVMSLFGSTEFLQYIQSDIDKVAGSIGRGMLAAAIWIPYFLTSKRVRATLIK